MPRGDSFNRGGRRPPTGRESRDIAAYHARSVPGPMKTYEILGAGDVVLGEVTTDKSWSQAGLQFKRENPSLADQIVNVREKPKQ